MKPPSMMLALLLLLGIAVLCAQRWGREAGRAACAGQVQALQGALQRQNVAVYRSNRNNLFIVALSIGFGMLPLVAEQYAQHMPKALSPLLHSGILLAAIVAVLLNLFFNGLASPDEAREKAKENSHGSE